LNAEGRLEIVGEPEIGKDIEVIFTFTPLAELKYLTLRKYVLIPI